MSKKSVFVRFYHSDWRSGCIGMTFEQEGLYVRICAFIYETRQRVPLCDSEAARKLGANTNAYRAIKNQLLALGKLRVVDDGYTVTRCDKEIAHADRANGVATVDEVSTPRSATEVHGRNTSADAVGDTPVDTHLDARVDTPVDTPPVQGKKAEQNQCSLRDLDLRVKEKTPLTPHGEVVANAPTKARKAPDGISKAECIGAFIQFSELAQRIGLPIPATMTPGREKSIRSRLRDHGAASWSTALAAIEASDFLRGRSEKADFKISLDWLIGPKNFPKVIDGNYGPKIAASTSETHWTQDPAKVAAVTPDQWRGSIAKYANGTWPVDKLGYWPGHRNCIVPPQIVRELKLLDKYDEICGIAKGEWKREQDRAHA